MASICVPCVPYPPACDSSGKALANHRRAQSRECESAGDERRGPRRSGYTVRTAVALCQLIGCVSAAILPNANAPGTETNASVVDDKAAVVAGQAAATVALVGLWDFSRLSPFKKVRKPKGYGGLFGPECQEGGIISTGPVNWRARLSPALVGTERHR